MSKHINGTIPVNLSLWIEDNELKYKSVEIVLSETDLYFIKTNEKCFYHIITESKQQSIKVYPLTHNQKAQWFFNQIDPENISYNIAVAGKIKHPFRHDLFRKAVAELTERHILLRTIFVEIEGEESACCQVVKEKLIPFVQDIDVTKFSRKQVDELIYEKYRIPFDLRTGPLLKTYLFHSKEFSYFLLNIHHIICDAWSLKIFLKELFEIYDSLLNDKEPDIEPVKVDYGEYTFYVSNFLKSSEGIRQLTFWSNLLINKDFPLVLPYDFERPSVQSFNGATHRFSISADLFQDLNKISENLCVTPNVVLFTLFEFLLSKLSSQKQFYIGMPVSARTKKEFLHVFGYMINLVPVNCNIDETKKASDHIRENKSNILTLLGNQEVPFPYIVESVSPKRNPAISPIFQVMYNFMNKMNLGHLLDLLNPSSEEFKKFGTLEINPYPINDQEGQFDLTLEILHTYDKFDCVFKYNTDLFKLESVRYFEKEYISLLVDLIKNPDFLPSFDKLNNKNSETGKINFKITGSFTVEPIKPYLEFWLDKFGSTISIEFPGYNQIFPQLLNPSSEFNLNHNGYNVLLVRLEDWMSKKNSESSIQDFINRIDEFENSLKGSLQINPKCKYILAFCPSSIKLHDNATLNKLVNESEIKLSALFKTNSNVIVLNSDELINTYGIVDYYEEMGEEIGHIPFTESFFVSLATLIARKVHIFLSTPFKAVVVDCDNTLWKGVVGEDGPLGVKIGQEEKILQEFLIQQHNSGVLICLCSKNREEDVFEVFEKNDQMILKRENISFHRINWESKAKNLVDLAKEINIGTDSFVFIDDNPMECAEVRNIVPETLILQVPSAGFTEKELRNLWIFDRSVITDEDRKRAEKYREEAMRNNFKSSSRSFKDFIDGLDLKIEIRPFNQENFPRISQLTYRTNQFNFTTLRKDENEIRQFAFDSNYECFQVSVKDKFGDYGLVGVIIANKSGGYSVETFLLSCRVLGKGVEHSLISFLGERATKTKSEFLSLNFRKTVKNMPSENFIKINFGDLPNIIENEVLIINIPCERARDFKFNPEGIISEIKTEEEGKTNTQTFANEYSYRDRNDFYYMIFNKFLSLENIISEMNKISIKLHMKGSVSTVDLKEIEKAVLNIWQQVLKRNDFGTNDNFFDIGGHSVLIPQIVINLRKQSNINVNIVDVFQYPTVKKLSAFISESDNKDFHLITSQKTKGPRTYARCDIAVIGMACRFPGANSINEYWNNLLEGKETINHFTDEELAKYELNYNELKNNPDYVKARGILKDIDKFDAGFFSMTPREAAITDPQHRVWLENAWDAFENAGFNPFCYTGSVGVFAGGFVNTYLLNNVLRDPVKMENYIRMRSTESLEIYTGNDVAFIPTKTSYKFNLRGPAINVQTACSTSLVAISQACQSLINYDSDICLAGGVCITVPQENGYLYQEGAITSPDGVCRPFDAKGNGTVFSNGVGAVVLKRLEDAIRDRDTIYSVVTGWATNNDGNNKISYLAPSIDGQADVILMAQSLAEVSPEQISYIEAHGTATNLGDPIEIAALKKAFSRGTNKKQFCGIGSVKSNIGHTDAVAGVASFIKACLAAYHRVLPPTINFSEPNKLLNIEDSPFFIQNELKVWKEDKPLIIGVSSFGVGGTNAHVIIKEPTRNEKGPAFNSEGIELLLLSAKTDYSLKKRHQELLDFIKAKPELNLQDVAYTLGSGRSHMPHRSFLVTSGLKELSSENIDFITQEENIIASGIAFMFPGQGAQYLTMGIDLYNSNRVFRQILDECFEIFRSETGRDLKLIMFAPNRSEDSDRKLNNTEIAQPALFIIEYALYKVLEQINIKPDYLIGHSIGEYTAACIAGVFDLRTALKIVIKRGQLMQGMPTGNMLAVRTCSDVLKSLNSAEFEIAADNSPSSCSISFVNENRCQIEELLNGKGIPYIDLNTSHAFHSKAFDPILSEFSDYVDQFSLNTPVLPFISCLTGEFISANEATSGIYWANQLRNTVLFRQGISTIAESKDIIYLEVGPETHLSSLTKQNVDVVNKKTIISTLGKFDHVDERYKILTALGNLFNLGINIDFDLLMQDNKPFKISLPTYPYERKRHWVDFQLPHDFKRHGSSFSPIKDFFRIRTGKIDKKVSALENIDLLSTEVNKVNIFTPTEQIIFNIWSDAFMMKNISKTDNFFEIGGDSLLAITVVSKIKTAFKVDLSFRALIDSPKIEDLAKIVDSARL
jgi:FkbH-like protein